MQVFISWSGEQSKKLADAIRAWLQPVLQSVEPYFSHVDIDTGARWYSELVEALEKSNVGLIILTQENLNNPWIMFEAGAIARSVERVRVCPILFGIQKADLKGPLSFFQAAEFEKDFRGVVNTINKSLENPLPDQTLDRDLRAVVAAARNRSEGHYATTISRDRTATLRQRNPRGNSVEHQSIEQQAAGHSGHCPRCERSACRRRGRRRSRQGKRKAERKTATAMIGPDCAPE
jgi:TIR domain